MSAAEPCGTVYELTVVGALGPVLRHALEPCGSAPPELHTVLRAGMPAHADLVDLVLLLDSTGLEIAAVSAVT
jgi:hypothetical protein